MKFTTDLSAKVCMEAAGACDFSLTIANNIDIPYIDCTAITSDDVNQQFHGKGEVRYLIVTIKKTFTVQNEDIDIV